MLIRYSDSTCIERGLVVEESGTVDVVVFAGTNL